MGWAKYFEDNMSIYTGRMAMRESIPVRQVRHNKQTVHKTLETRQDIIPIDAIVTRSEKQNGRKGLELTFQYGVEESMIRKLQMNGWWWSKVKACWCNLDTKGNRKFAEALLCNGASLSVVA